MPLVELKSNLRNQSNPYQKNGENDFPLIISEITGKKSPDSPDFLLRGDDKVRVTDAERLTKWFKTPAGIRFVTKQNLLPYAFPTLNPTANENQGTRGLIEQFTLTYLSNNIYNPINSILQARAAGTGTRFLARGLDPTGLSDLSIFTYLERTGLKESGILGVTGPQLLYNRQTQFGLSNLGKSRKRLDEPISPGVRSLSDPDLVDFYNASAVDGPISNSEELEILNELIDKDIINFYIKVPNNDNPELNEYVFLRAYFENLSETINGEYNSYKMVGRGENFYRYGGFTDTLTLSFKVVALSKAEMKGIYNKLNYLKSLLMPDYSKSGFMRGNLIKLTIGDYFKQVPGYLTGLSYNIPTDYGWDIARNDQGELIDKQLPTIIDVTGFTFIPLYEELPRKGGKVISGAIPKITRDEQPIELATKKNEEVERDIIRRIPNAPGEEIGEPDLFNLENKF